MQTKSIKGETIEYIVRNILASLGLSLYVFADTLFISIDRGSIGLAALNITLPMFSFFNSIALMLGVGGSAIFSMNKITNPQKVESLFGNLLTLCATLGIGITLITNLFSRQLLTLMGATAQTMPEALNYFRIVGFAAPFFMCNYLIVNFVRNDDNPRLTMIATITETLVVVFFDWIFVIVMNWGMEGAAIATFFSPCTSLLILSRHKKFPKRRLKIKIGFPTISVVWRVSSLGLASFLTELSSGLSIVVFNNILLNIAGDYGIAAYGVLANILLIVLAIFNGIALGIQPVASREYGLAHHDNVARVIRLGLMVSFVLATISYILLVIFKLTVIAVFNTQNQPALVKYASYGLPIFFFSIFFSSQNVINTVALAATNHARGAFSMSLLRGYVVLLLMVFILPKFLGITGVWVSLPTTEILVAILGFILVKNIITLRKED